MISGVCIVIVLVGFGLVLGYMYGVHVYIKDAESNDGKSDTSHH